MIELLKFHILKQIYVIYSIVESFNDLFANDGNKFLQFIIICTARQNHLLKTYSWLTSKKFA